MNSATTGSALTGRFDVQAPDGTTIAVWVEGEGPAAAIPGARIQVLEGHAHVAHRTDPAMVAALIRGFVTSST